MCTSQFVTQTRNSLNPVMNLSNLQHPAVALHQAEAGLAMAPPPPKPATPQTVYGGPDPAIAAAHAALAQGRGFGNGDASVSTYGMQSYRGPSLLG
jgi:hypothetical protein